MLDGQPAGPGYARLAPHRHEFLEEAVREVGHGGLRRRLSRERILAPLDAVDGGDGLAPMLVDRAVADPSRSDPLQAGPRDRTIQSLRPVVWTRTPKPATALSRKIASLSSAFSRPQSAWSA